MFSRMTALLRSTIAALLTTFGGTAAGDPLAALADIRELADRLTPTWGDSLEALRASGVPVAAYDNVISRTDAAATIPEEVSNAMLKGITDESFVLNQFTRLNVPTNQTRFPVLAALPVAYWVNGDTGLKQTTEINWTNKYLNIEEIAVIVPIPEAVLDDSSFDVWGEVRPKLETAAARVLDATVLFGTNAPGTFPTNVVAAAAAAGNTYAIGTNNAAAGGIDEDVNQLISLVEQDGYDPDLIAASKVLRRRLRGARDSQGRRQEGVTIDRVQETPVVYPFTGGWPTSSGTAAAVALQKDQFVVGVRQDFTYKILDQAVIQDGAGDIQFNLAQQDMVALRMVLRVGWQVANTINYDQPVEASRYPAGNLTNP